MTIVAERLTERLKEREANREAALDAAVNQALAGQVDPDALLDTLEKGCTASHPMSAAIDRLDAAVGWELERRQVAVDVVRLDELAAARDAAQQELQDIRQKRSELVAKLEADERAAYKRLNVAVDALDAVVKRKHSLLAATPKAELRETLTKANSAAVVTGHRRRELVERLKSEESEIMRRRGELTDVEAYEAANVVPKQCAPALAAQLQDLEKQYEGTQLALAEAIREDEVALDAVRAAEAAIIGT